MCGLNPNLPTPRLGREIDGDPTEAPIPTEGTKCDPVRELSLFVAFFPSSNEAIMIGCE